MGILAEMRSVLLLQIETLLEGWEQEVAKSTLQTLLLLLQVQLLEKLPTQESFKLSFYHN